MLQFIARPNEDKTIRVIFAKMFAYRGSFFDRPSTPIEKDKVYVYYIPWKQDLVVSVMICY